MTRVPLSIRAGQLRDLIARSEDELMVRVLGYAQRFGYTRYTSTLAEAWRASVAGLSQPILEALETSDHVRELDPDEDYAGDPIAAFGILEAKRHRARGIALGMFLGLMKYYRQSYTDVITEARFAPEDEEWALQFVNRTFDRVELGYATEWASASSTSHLEELQAANRALANEKNKYLTLFSSLGPPVLLLDGEGRVTDMNFAAERLFLGGEHPGESYYGREASHPLPECLAEAMRSFHLDGRLQRRSLVTLDVDDQRRDYEVLIRQMHDVSGKFDGVTIVLTDVTDLLRLGRQLQEAHDILEQRVAERTCELQQAMESLHQETLERERRVAEQRRLEIRMREVHKLESLGVLAGGVAHDFNNLLTAILGNTELVVRGLADGDSARERLGQVEAAAHHAADLCRQMLAYSGRGQLESHEIELGALVGDMLDLLRASVPKSIELKLRIAPQMVSVQGDASQLRQVALNLVGNAADAIGDRGGTVQIGVETVHCSRADLDSSVLGLDLREGEYVVLSVSDRGCGMDAATLERVFDPFFTTKFAGRGLGLAVVLGIVRGHAGTIDIQSEPGQGTTFRVLLPAMASFRVAVPRPPLCGIMPGPVRASGKLLLVDDDEMVRSMAAIMLGSVGWDVLEAGGGHEALALWETHRGDIARIVLDVTMPGLDGPATMTALRADGCEVPIVLISGYDEHDISARCAGLDVAAVVHKPFTLEELVGALAGAHPLPSDGVG
jgi:signal transduction histidine kinase